MQGQLLLQQAVVVAGEQQTVVLETAAAATTERERVVVAVARGGRELELERVVERQKLDQPRSLAVSLVGVVAVVAEQTVAVQTVVEPLAGPP